MHSGLSGPSSVFEDEHDTEFYKTFNGSVNIMCSGAPQPNILKRMENPAIICI